MSGNILELTQGMANMVKPYELLKTRVQGNKELRPCDLKHKTKVILRARLSEAQNHRCGCCGVRFTDNPKDRTYATIDHFIGRGYGGSWTWWNCAVTCADCNGKRGCSIDDVIEVFG